MSSLESLVPSLALCQQLQAAGFPQDTAMVWGDVRDANNTIIGVVIPRRDAEAGCIGADCDGQMVLCAAPTAEEILKELPETVVRHGRNFPLGLQKYNGAWMAGWYYNGDGEQPGVERKPLVQIAADAYLWWKKKVAG